MSHLDKTVVNNITFNTNTDQPTPKHRHWPLYTTSVSWTGKEKYLHTQWCNWTTGHVLTIRPRSKPAVETGRFSERGRNLQIQKEMKKNNKKGSKASSFLLLTLTIQT